MTWRPQLDGLKGCWLCTATRVRTDESTRMRGDIELREEQLSRRSASSLQDRGSKGVVQSILSVFWWLIRYRPACIRMLYPDVSLHSSSFEFIFRRTVRTQCSPSSQAALVYRRETYIHCDNRTIAPSSTNHHATYIPCLRAFRT